MNYQYYLRRGREMAVLGGPEDAIADLREFAHSANSEQERADIERAVQALQTQPISPRTRARIIRAEQEM